MKEIPDDVIKFETFRGTYTIPTEGLPEDSRRRCLEKIERIASIQLENRGSMEDVKGRYRMTPNVLLTANENNF